MLLRATSNTSHLRDDEGINFWLSSIVSHGLGMLCGDFQSDLSQVPGAVSSRGPRILEEFDPGLGEWLVRTEARDGLYLLPQPPPRAGLFRLRFDQFHENEPEP